MTALQWDRVGTRRYKTGVDHGVLYMPDSQGAYSNGVSWSGLISVTESPSGAEPNKQYADNIEYLNLFSAEMFAATIEAFTYPDEFALYNGLAVPTPGVTIGQQPRKTFGFAYRTLLGDDVEDTALGYELHLVYGAKASPSEQANTTVNDTPEAQTLSWSISTTPVIVEGLKPTSIVTVNSTQVDPATLAALELILYGSDGVDPAMPLPDTIVSMFQDGVTIVTPTQPAFNSGTHTITIPTVAGVVYYVNDEVVPAGALVITENTTVSARPADTYVFSAGSDDDWSYEYELTLVTPTVPSFNSGTNTITIPTQTGVHYTVDGSTVAAGALVITEDTFVVAVAEAGYGFNVGVDSDWVYTYTP